MSEYEKFIEFRKNAREGGKEIRSCPRCGDQFETYVRFPRDKVCGKCEIQKGDPDAFRRRAGPRG